MKLLKWALHYMYNLRNIETSDTAASTGLKPDINHPWKPFVVYSKINTDPLNMYCLVHVQETNSTVEFFPN